MDKKYRLRYQGKWMKVKHVLGTNTYELVDNAEDVELMSFNKAQGCMVVVSDDNDLNIKEIEMVEF